MRGTIVLAMWLLAVTAGCQLPPCPCNAPGSTTGDAEPPAAGELGGACLPDGSCRHGLVCAEDVCMPESTLLIFHNNSGAMCLAALDWLAGVQAERAALVVEEHLTTEAGEADLLVQLEAQYPASAGVSADFEYLPIIFFQGRAFSGFDDEVAQTLEALLEPQDAGT